MRRPSQIVAALALVLGCAAALSACGGDEGKVERVAMPDVVGMTVGQGERAVYDTLHTSLLYFDQSPADRQATNDWVIVATVPAAGTRTPTKRLVHAWALQRSEYEWFRAHETMPRLKNRADVATLLGPGGALADVKDLVQVRYRPGKAPKAAKVSPTDVAFTPDRGVSPDPSTEPAAEFALREGLKVAPPADRLVVGSRPGTGSGLRLGQYLVVLVITKPVVKVDPDPYDFSYTPPSSGGGGGTSGGGGGSGGIKIPRNPGFLLPTLPTCPKQLCG